MREVRRARVPEGGAWPPVKSRESDHPRFRNSAQRFYEGFFFSCCEPKCEVRERKGSKIPRTP